MKNLVEYVNENLDNKDFINEHPEIYDILECVEKWVVEEFAPEVQNWVCGDFATEVQNWVVNEYSPTIEQWIKGTFKEKMFKKKDSLKDFLKQSK